MSGGDVTVPAAALLAAVERRLQAVGVPPDAAAIVARMTVEADLQGRATHGVARLPAYVDKVVAGGIDPAAAVEVVTAAPTIVVLDGHDGFGQVVLHHAVVEATERSRASGIACVVARNLNNPGMLGAYARAALERGQIALIACNAAPAMAPPGGAEAMLGTDPLCIAIPATGGGMVLDMATTVASKGAIRAARRDGSPIPADWALDADGRPTTDPLAALEGLLLPSGGAKGAGLAIVIDLLAGILSGGAAGPDVAGLHDPGPSRVAAVVIAIDPGAFGPAEDVLARADAYLDRLRATRPVPGGTGVRVPGDRAAREREARQRSGVSVPAALWAWLADEARA